MIPETYYLVSSLIVVALLVLLRSIENRAGTFFWTRMRGAADQKLLKIRTWIERIFFYFTKENFFRLCRVAGHVVKEGFSILRSEISKRRKDAGEFLRAKRFLNRKESPSFFIKDIVRYKRELNRD